MENKNTKEIILDDEEKVIDPELIQGEVADGDDEDGASLDDELDPFKDKWDE